MTLTGRRAVTYSVTPLLALMLMQGLQQGEQNSLSQALSGLKHDFHTTDAVLGILPFAMAVTGVGASFPFGRLTDRRRRTTLLALAMLSWTFFIGVSALSVSLLMLFVLRMGLGAIEASSMAGLSLIGDYYPVAERAKRIGQWTAGALIGAAVAIGAGGPLVDAFGWRAAFAMWVPLGLLCTVLLLRMPEPERGLRDAEFHDAAEEHHLVGGIELPHSVRVGTSDYLDLSLREVIREVGRIKTFWPVTIAITVGNLMNAAVQFWGIEFFKRAHHLSTTSASGVAVMVGAGSGLGIVASGYLADRLLAKGDVNARLHVGVAGAVLGAVFLTPAWLIGNLWVAAPFFFLGGMGLTLPAPAIDAVMTDVVVAEMRGRAIMIRSLVRVLSNIGPAVVGGLALLPGGLPWALAVTSPLLLISAWVLWRCRPHYADDLSFACAESKRLLGT